MVRFTLRLFGVPIISVDRVCYEFEYEEETARIEGGSAHNFERDFTPIAPEDRYNWEWTDRGFGFR